MTPPRILLVDDQRQVSRVLRSSLELSGREYIISEVASAEEALAEIDRTPVDLLVTDLRLPAMSGLQLVERAKSINPRMQTVLITGNPTEEIRRRAEKLGVVAFLPKPIGTNYFLEIVQAALEVAEEDEAAGDEERRKILQDHLSALRGEVGASAVYLVDDQGEVLARAGEVADVDLGACLAPLMSAHRAALTVSHRLGSQSPANFHHLEGEAHDFYLTNVGERHGLLIVHRGQQEAGRFGSVVHYGRRSADLLLLHVEEKAEVVGSEEEEIPAARWEVVMSEGPEKELSPDELAAAAEDVDEGGAEDFWEEASERSMKPDVDEDSLTYEQAREMGLLEDDTP